MSTNPLAQAVEAYFKANWATTPIDWMNIVFVPPANLPWIRFSIVPSEAERITITGNATSGQEHKGNFIIQFFAPKDSGAGTIQGYMDTVSTLFNEVDIDVSGTPCRCGVPVPQVVGETDIWFQMNLNVPYIFQI